MTKFYFPAYDPLKKEEEKSSKEERKVEEGKVGYARVFISNDPSDTPLPIKPFFVENVDAACHKLFAGETLLDAKTRICWSPVIHAEAKDGNREPNNWQGPSANLTAVLAIADYKSKFLEERLQTDVVWATGQLEDCLIQSVESILGKVNLFLEFCKEKNLVAIFLIPIEHRSHVLNSLSDKTKEEINECQFVPKLSISNNKPVIIWIGDDQLQDFIHWAQGHLSETIVTPQYSTEKIYSKKQSFSKFLIILLSFSLLISLSANTYLYLCFQQVNQQINQQINQISYFQQSADIQAEVGLLIKSAKKEILFSGINFHISATDRKPIILEKLRDGVVIRYLIIDPYGSNLGHIASDFGQTTEGLRTECITGLRGILDIQQTWQKDPKYVPNKLQIRLVDLSPHGRFYIFDSYESTGKVLFTPYINGTNSPNLPAFLLANESDSSSTNKNDSSSAVYCNALNKLWETGTSFDTWLSNNPTFDEDKGISNNPKKKQKMLLSNLSNYEK